MNLNIKADRSNIPFLVLCIILGAGSALAVGNLDSDLGLFGLLGLIGIALALSMFIIPSWGANILIIAIFSNISDELTNNGYPGIIKPLVLVVAITIAARYIYIEKTHPAHSKTAGIEATLGLFFLVVAASFIMASDKDRAIGAILDLGKDIVVIFCIFFALRTPEAWKRAVWVVILVTFALSLLGVYQSVSGNYSSNYFGLAMVKIDELVAGSSTPRLGGPINAPNMWGQTVVSVIALLVFRIVHEQRISIKLFGVMILGVLLFETLNTYSRGAYLALAIILIWIFFVIEYRFNPMITIAGLGLVLFAVPFLPANYTERFESLLVLTSSSDTSIYQDSSIRGRSSEMLTGLSMFESSPLLGVGAGNYKNNYQEFTQKIGIEVRAEARDPHSLYIQLLAENGLLGFLAFIAVVTSLFSALAKARKSIEYMPALKQSWAPWIISMQASLFAYLIAATFLHGAYIRYFWILFALGMSAVRLTDEMLRESNRSSLEKEGI